MNTKKLLIGASVIGVGIIGFYLLKKIKANKHNNSCKKYQSCISGVQNIDEIDTICEPLRISLGLSEKSCSCYNSKTDTYLKC